MPRRSDPVPVRAATALLEARSRAEDSLLAQLVAFVRNVLGLLAGPGPHDDAQQAVSLIVDAVEAGQRQVADLTRVYVDTVLALDGSARTVLPEVDRDALERDWSVLVDRYLEERTDELMSEIEQALADDVQRASNAAAETPGVVGYRRVIHPELSVGGVCGLCVAAAHRLYRKADLKPIHARCKCTVLPATEARDLGLEINNADLGAVYGAANTTDGRTLKQVRFKAPGGELEAVKSRKARGKLKPRKKK